MFIADSSRLARAGATTTLRCARSVLRRLVLDRTTIVAVARAGAPQPARELGRPWDTVNAIAVAATGDLFATPGRPGWTGVRVTGSTSTAGPTPATATDSST